MPPIHFTKYHGAGNDFVIVDDREGQYAFAENQATIARLCARHTGIGADGLIFVRIANAQLRMVYYNADGAPSSFCGNGSRCFAQACYDLGLVSLDKPFSFTANDGEHTATLLAPDRVEVSMRVSASAKTLPDGNCFVDTGSPHVVTWSEVLPKGDITAAAHAIRYNEAFAKTGVNVNFCAPTPNGIAIRTYERGVEGETLACGTGVTAAAIVYAEREGLTGEVSVAIEALGGNLEVRFSRDGETEAPKHVRLVGPSVRVFEGQWSQAL